MCRSRRNAEAICRHAGHQRRHCHSSLVLVAIKRNSGARGTPSARGGGGQGAACSTISPIPDQHASNRDAATKKRRPANVVSRPGTAGHPGKYAVCLGPARGTAGPSRHAGKELASAHHRGANKERPPDIARHAPYQVPAITTAAIAAPAATRSRAAMREVEYRWTSVVKVR